MRSIRFVGSLAVVSCFLACGQETSDEDEASQPVGGAANGGGASTPAGSSGSGAASGGDASGGSPMPEGPPEFSVLGVTMFRHGAKAAYSIVHDDTCAEDVDNQFEIAAPELEERGLVASFGTIGQHCVSREGVLDELADLLAKGHEIINHTWDHPDLVELDPSDAAVAIDQGKSAIVQNVPGASVDVFIFPYDSFNDELISYLSGSGYLGARAGERGYNDGDFEDPFRLKFDVFGPGYSVYAGREGSACESVLEGASWETTSAECRSFTLNDYVDEVIAGGGYGVRELHSVEGEAWEPVPRSEYEEHLDHVVTKVDAGDLWVGTVGDVIRYRMAREACPLPGSVGRGLTFAAPTGDCAKYRTSLTYRIETKPGYDAPTSAQQNGREIPLEPFGDEWLVTANPSDGPVVLD